jgi:hypothetical protein
MLLNWDSLSTSQILIVVKSNGRMKVFNVHTQMPDVTWSTVPGPRSKGYDFKNLDDAVKCFESVSRQMARFKIIGSKTIMTEDGVVTAMEVVPDVQR